jgi:hypothetical protein
MIQQYHSWGYTRRNATQVTPKAPHTHVYCSAIQVMETTKCPPPDKWIKKMCYLYTMEFYSAMKKNKISSFASKWMELENIILSKVSHTQKTKNHMFSLICRL